NVFTIIKFNYTFTYVLAGVKRSFNNTSLSTYTFKRSFCILESRYYVIDTGFGTQLGIIIPFSNIKYYL
ncbi:uncharacterized protein B0T23DRAFT_319933, partial [Neurospora hispaniola]